MSGRSAKGARQRAKEQAAAAASNRRAYWPALALVVISGFAFFYFAGKHNSRSSRPTAGSSAYPYVIGTPGVGTVAPAVKLPATSGAAFDLASNRGKQVLLYFQEGLTCQPCWDQIAVIQKDRAKFTALGIGPIVGITTDPLNLISQKAQEAILLTKADCDLCEQAKGVLARVGETHDLHVREVSLETEEGKRLGLEAGAPFPPVLFLDGKPFSYGRLSERRLRKALR